MGRYLGKVMVAGPNPAEGSIFEGLVDAFVYEQSSSPTVFGASISDVGLGCAVLLFNTNSVMYRNT